MKIIVSGRHLQEFPELETYAREKVQKLTKYSPKILKIQIRLISEKAHRGQEDDYCCEIEIDIPGKNLILSDVERSMDKAIDKAIERARVVLIKEKEKRISKKHKAGVVQKEELKF